MAPWEVMCDLPGAKPTLEHFHPLLQDEVNQERLCTASSTYMLTAECMMHAALIVLERHSPEELSLGKVIRTLESETSSVTLPAVLV